MEHLIALGALLFLGACALHIHLEHKGRVRAAEAQERYLARARGQLELRADEEERRTRRLERSLQVRR